VQSETEGCLESMASISNPYEYLGELQKVTPETKGTAAAATLIVKQDLARQAALHNANKWRMTAVVLSGAVLFLAFKKWWR
jgi:hypothetical protein